MDLVMVAWRSRGQGTANDDQFLAMCIQDAPAIAEDDQLASNTGAEVGKRVFGGYKSINQGAWC
jgi:hypothetical protein